MRIASTGGINALRSMSSNDGFAFAFERDPLTQLT